MDTQLAEPTTTTISFQPITDNDIVEMEDQAILSSLREGTTRCYFTVGDIAIKYIARAEEEGYRVKRTGDQEVYISQSRIFEAIGFFFGKKGRTVRYYFETARFYPREVRDEFENLPFDTFVMARSFGDGWREVLEYAADNPSLSTPAVDMHFRTLLDPASFSSVSSDDPETQNEYEKSQRTLELLSRLVESLSRFFKTVKISPMIEQRTGRIMSDFRSLIVDIARELKAKNAPPENGRESKKAERE